jgi:hypothetical protein
MHTFLGFRNGKLVTVIQSTLKEVENAIDMDNYVMAPQEAEQQIAKWKQENP